jgi:putative membrane protein
MLASHIILAIVIVPLVLITLNHAIKGRLIVHRQWARWTFPIWYYVSVTGVLVYFFLYQWFPAAKP